MKLVWIVTTTAVLVAFLVLTVVGVGWWFFGRNMGGGIAWAQERSDTRPYGWGSWGHMGMMGSYYNSSQDFEYPGACCGWSSPIGIASDEPLTIDQAGQAVEEYIVDASDTSLELDELMEFNRNFYTIVKEDGTGIADHNDHAMRLVCRGTSHTAHAWSREKTS